MKCKPVILSILCAAEYVPIGTAKLKGLEQYSTIPYIVPFLGKNSIAVEGTGLATDIMLKSIMISALEQTAAGQLSVSIYNPEWRDTFSCFAILDDFESISSQDGLSKLFDRLSEQISAADSVLNRMQLLLQQELGDQRAPVSLSASSVLL